MNKRGRPRPDTGPLKTISMQVDPRDLAKFDRAAKRMGMSRQAFIRDLIRDVVGRPGPGAD